MNIVSISGNLGKDVELRHLPDGTPVASFSVADSQGRDKPSIWWNCAIFGKRAEALSPYLLKGTQVTVNGSVTEREYTDKNGQQRKSMDVRVNDVALQGGKREQSDQGGYAPTARSAPATRQTAAPQGGFDKMDDDLPW